MTPLKRPPVYTIGHSTRSVVEFVELLKQGRVELVVDIRSTPRPEPAMVRFGDSLRHRRVDLDGTIFEFDLCLSQAYFHRG